MVLDTNVIYSAFVSPNGVCAALLTATIHGQIDLILASELIDEYRTVLLRPQAANSHRMSESEIVRFFELLMKHSFFVKLPEPLPRVSRDKDDDKFVACAIAGNADVIVSGDIHLLEFEAFGEILVMRPHELATRLQMEL